MAFEFPRFLQIRAGESVDIQMAFIRNKVAQDLALFDIACDLVAPSGASAFTFDTVKETSEFLTGVFRVQADAADTADLVPQVYDCNVRFKRNSDSFVFLSPAFLVEVLPTLSAEPAEA